MRLYVNQMGYLPKSKKTVVIATLGTDSEAPDLPFSSVRIYTEDGRLVLEKEIVSCGLDAASGDYVWQADFSDLEAEGRYICKAGDTCSHPFSIGTELYENLNYLLCKMFYYQRCGMELTKEYAGQYARPTCHEEPVYLWSEYEKLLAGELTKEQLRTYKVLGGWHDAGDFGRYTTAGACALAHLLYAYRFFPESFQGKLNIPESGNGMPDLLNECRYELLWLLQMQTEDGGVYHKLTTQFHAPFVMPHEDKEPMLLYPVSSMAVAGFVGVMALASRVYRPFDSQFSDALLSAAEKSNLWLEQHPEFIGFRNPKNSGTGEYGDFFDMDERCWALAELYRCTGEAKYLSTAASLFTQLQEKNAAAEFGWSTVSGFAGWAMLEPSLLPSATHTNASVSDEEQGFRKKIIETFLAKADRLIQTSKACGYGAALLPKEYGWGSNMVLLNHGMLLSTAYLLNRNSDYLDAAIRQMDYLLGVNATDYSYVTGVGAHAFSHPHNRITEAADITETIPGYVSGGPNARPADPVAKENVAVGTPPMKCFYDHWSCYSLNEITIYWNSPAVFVAAFLDQIRKNA